MCISNDLHPQSPAEVLPKRYRGVGATLGAASGGLGAVAAYLAEGAFIRDYPIIGWRYGFYVGAFFTLQSGVMLYFCKFSLLVDTAVLILTIRALNSLHTNLPPDQDNCASSAPRH